MNRKPIVVIESPYKGKVELNKLYLAACLKDSLLKGEAPFASHGLYTLDGVLNDNNVEERKLGISTGFTFHLIADLIVFYTDLGFSSGMLEAEYHAKKLGKPIIYRKLNPRFVRMYDEELYEKFVSLDVLEVV